jgi:hypothetical protein
MPTCFRCPNEGSFKWGDTLALTHGFSQIICERCATELQLEYAEERAAAIPELRAKLEELGGPAEHPICNRSFVRTYPYKGIKVSQIAHCELEEGHDGKHDVFSVL